MVDGNEIRLASDIPESVRTPGKDEAAAWIEEFVVQSGKDMPKLQIAKGSGWSRQHISNTLRDYFSREPGESADHQWLEEHNVTDQRESVGRDELQSKDNSEQISLPVERIIEMTRESYREGYQDCMQSSR